VIAATARNHSPPRSMRLRRSRPCLVDLCRRERLSGGMDRTAEEEPGGGRPPGRPGPPPPPRREPPPASPSPFTGSRAAGWMICKTWPRGVHRVTGLPGGHERFRLPGKKCRRSSFTGTWSSPSCRPSRCGRAASGPAAQHRGALFGGDALAQLLMPAQKSAVGLGLHRERLLSGAWGC
jgi:hypothetical protein